MGLGWPRPVRGGASALGWPRQKSESADEAPQPEPQDVSRETTPLLSPAAGDAGVSRETEPEEGHAVDVGEAVAPAAPAWPSGAWPLPSTARIIGVANQKGGVGKTTSTVNLSVALALHGARVLVVDLDPQGNSSTAFSVEHREGTPSIYDVLVHGRALSEVAAPVDGVPLLRCAPATIDLAGAEIELVSMVAREMRLSKALAAAAVDYDYVFIDCPPSLGLLTVNALVAAREVLIPIQCEFYALEGLSQLLRNIELVRAHLNPTLHVSTILLTMFDARTRLAEQVADEVRNHFGPIVLTEPIPRSVRISEAPGYGQSVMTYDPGSRGARAYARAAYELAERAETEEGTTS
jgi:chromosome partitioning protein